MPRSSPRKQEEGYYGHLDNSSFSSLVPLNPLNPVPTITPSAQDASKVNSERDDSNSRSSSRSRAYDQSHIDEPDHYLSANPQRGRQRLPHQAAAAASTAANSTTNSPLLPRPLILGGSSTMGTSSNPLSLFTGKLSANGAAGDRSGGKKPSWKLILSYVTDWVVLLAFAMVAMVLGNIEPIKRPFSLDNETISFPYKEHETVPVWVLFITNATAPILIVAVVALIFVPGPTVPKGTPRALIWKRKLWELHTGWLGLALAMCAAMFVTNGLKNMFGKPRPDLLSRCKPDLARKEEFLIGFPGTQHLVTHEICTETDSHKLNDGFRSFPSGHSSSSAAGLIYLSLFIASKFTITIPFVTQAGYSSDDSFAAFPSRLPQQPAARQSTSCVEDDPEAQALSNISSHSRAVLAVRRQAAAPPLYLFGIALLPFFCAVFIASSRWFDYRHHAFDIFSGFLIGTLGAILGFRYYHMPVSQGAGWAWGPRSVDKAFWAGLGSYSFATDKKKYYIRAGDEEEAIESSGPPGARPSRHNSAAMSLSTTSKPAMGTVAEGESTSIHSRG